MRRDYFVYIMANMHRTIYIGVTNNLERRVLEHKQRSVPGFTAKYGLTELVFHEIFSHP
jgi:putative endonuclease